MRRYMVSVALVVAASASFGGCALASTNTSAKTADRHSCGWFDYVPLAPRGQRPHDLRNCQEHSGQKHIRAIVAAAAAPLMAGEHHHVRAFCDAYTPQAARELVRDRRPRIAGDCETAMRALVENPLLGQLDARVLTAQRVRNVVIHGDQATVRVTSGSRGGVVVRFANTPSGHWKIASLSFSSQIITRIG
jgi:type IV pilus biogenesis protein CpaD/CtpE